MKNQDKTLKQLINELTELRQRTVRLEKLETEHRKAEKSLKESEERYRELFDEAPVGYHEYDQEGRITNVNRTDLGMLGYTRKEMIGQFIWKFHVEEEVAYQQILAKLSGTLPPGRSLERTYRRKDGTTFPALFEDRLIRDEKGQIKGIRCIIQDFTERKQMDEALEKARNELEERVIARTSQLAQKIEVYRRAEEALQRSEEAATRLARENALIAEIGRIISSTPNIEEVYPLFSQKIMELIPFDRIGINLINLKEDTHTVPYVAGLPVSGRQPGDVAPMAGTLLEKVLQSQKGIIIRMDREEEVAAEFPGLLPDFQEGFRSGLTVPLISGGEVIGGLALRSRGIGVYTDRDLSLAEGIGNQIAGAITNAQLYTEQRRVEEEREKLIKDLQEALARVKQLSGMLPICSSCKKIRDDKGYWNQIEVYVRDHSEAEFTHGMCPECMKKLYPDFSKDQGN